MENITKFKNTKSLTVIIQSTSMHNHKTIPSSIGA